MPVPGLTPCWLSDCIIGVPPSVLLPDEEPVVGWFVGVLPAWSLRTAAGEGTLRGAGDEWPRCDGVETLWAAVVGRFEADEGCAGCKGVGVDICQMVC